ncbi:LysR family transcriptional regulator [Micromonospora sp. NPDC049366]|uniref:LysR family transcriptional regulator n=1 Tax=Micromonospora sp. NPDC049366 TaxID=3364271 RepID=UPI003790659A
MLDVRRLRLLCDLSRLGTIAAVAQAHTYTPSAVSQQLSALEREAGVPLLERSGRRVTFTPAGRVLVAHAETVLAALEQTTAALAAVATGLTGPLRIGAFPTAVRTLLPATLVALGRQHPGLELTVTELDPVEVPAALRERRLDVGLLHDYDVVPVDPDPALDTVPLLDETVFLAVPTGSPPAVPARAPVSRDVGAPIGHGVGTPSGRDVDPLRAARDAAWIMASPGTLCHTVTLQLCRSAGFTPRVRHQADDFATVLALVAADQGVSLVPQLAAVDPPAGVRLVALGSRRRTRVAYRRGAAPHPAVAAFVAAVRAATDDVLTR